MVFDRLDQASMQAAATAQFCSHQGSARQQQAAPSATNVRPRAAKPITARRGSRQQRAERRGLVCVAADPSSVADRRWARSLPPADQQSGTPILLSPTRLHPPLTERSTMATKQTEMSQIGLIGLAVMGQVRPERAWGLQACLGGRAHGRHAYVSRLCFANPKKGPLPSCRRTWHSTLPRRVSPSRCTTAAETRRMPPCRAQPRRVWATSCAALRSSKTLWPHWSDPGGCCRCAGKPCSTSQTFAIGKFPGDVPGALCTSASSITTSSLPASTANRRVIILVKAGAPVDSTIAQLAELMEEGDIIVDGGNEW